MYAVIKTGGKQYTVHEGDLLKVEKLTGDVGAKLEISDVLAVGEAENIKIGTPLVEGASVLAEVVEQGKHKKVIVYKKKRRTGYDKRQGHRQQFTCLRIKEIRG